MRLSDMAMAPPAESEDEGADDSAGAFDDAAAEFYELSKKGDKAGAASALRAAIELCGASTDVEE